MKIGITGSSGNLGSYLKNQFSEYKLDYFNGRIEKKSDINKWIKGKNFDVIIHLAAIVPTSIVNKHKNKALDVNLHPSIQVLGVKVIVSDKEPSTHSTCK